MSKLQAIKVIPQTEARLTVSKIFDEFVKEYESCSGDRDPAAWFLNQEARIKDDLVKVGVPRTSIPYGIATMAYDYYMAF
jgi:hypothetical protein